MPLDVFISYIAEDKLTADAACNVLEKNGIRCWMAPRDLVAGRSWGISIVEAIDNAKLFVLIFSGNANKSTQIEREVERAINKGIPILPLRIEDVQPTGALEYFLGSVHWLDALHPSIKADLEILAENIKKLLGALPPNAYDLPPRDTSRNGATLVRPTGGTAEAHFEPSLFVSHVSEDKEPAIQIVDELERRGVAGWVAPRDVRPGEPFDDEISHAIDNCLAMLLVFSSRCNDNKYIRRELTVAGEAGKHIVPFRIEDAAPKGGLRLRLSDLHWINAYVEREIAIDHLVKVQERLVRDLA
jgi:hypothetical protein